MKKLLVPLAAAAAMAAGSQAQAQAVMGTNISLFQQFSGGGGTFTFDDTTRIVLHNSNGSADNQRLLDLLNAPRGVLTQLRNATGLELNVTIVSNPTNKDIVLSDTPDAALTVMFDSLVLSVTRKGNTAIKTIGINVETEGYQYQAGSSGVSLKFAGDKAAIRAVQSLVNIVMQDGAGAGAHRSVPTGTGIDYPQYEERSYMVDVARWFIPVDTLIGAMEKMSMYKMNVLRLHLSDFYHRRMPNGDPWTDAHGSTDDAELQRKWEERLKGNGHFRLDIGDPARQAKITPDGKYYTKEDWEKLEDAAKRYGIEIIPEIGGPAHSDPWQQDNHPTLALVPAVHGGGFHFSTAEGERERYADYFAPILLAFRPWFESTDTMHLGMDESANKPRLNDVLWANLMADRIKYIAGSRENGYRYIRAWIEDRDPREPIKDFTYEGMEFEIWRDINNPEGMNANTRWISSDIAFYWTAGWTPVAYLTLSVNFHLEEIGPNVDSHYKRPGYLYKAFNERLDRWVGDHDVQALPLGWQQSSWNGTAYSYQNLANVSVVFGVGMGQTIPGMMLIGWNGEIFDGTRRLSYSDISLSFSKLRPGSHEISSHWLIDRFPYLPAQAAISIYTDVVRADVVMTLGVSLAPSGGGYFSALDYKRVGPNYRTEIWGPGWNPEDMPKAFNGPVMLRGSVAADIAGEGGMMSNGRQCRDTGYLLKEREVSACDEDTWSNNIGGTGSLNKKGAGHLRLLGANTFANGVVLDGGILEIGGNGSLGDAAGRVTFNGGTLSFAGDENLPASRNMAVNSGKSAALNANGNAVAIAGVISGSGGLKIMSMSKVTVTSRQQKLLPGGQGTVTVTVDVIDSIGMQSAPGTIELSGTNTFTGGVMLEGGVLRAGSAGALGAGNMLTFAGGTLSFGSDYTGSKAVVLGMDGFIDSNGNDITMSGVFSGSGDLRKTGQGELDLRGANTYTGATRVAAGLLKADIAALPDASDIYTSAGATVELSAAADGKHDGDIFGSGLIRKSGSNVLTLKGASQANWQVIAGRVISEGGFTGNVGFAGSGSRVFEFKQGSDISYAGVLSGSGEVVKSGGAALVLTGDSSGFAGTFEIGANSTMFVDSMLGGDVDVGASGVLGGRGKIGGDVMVASLGKLVSSRGWLTIGGDLDLDGEYEVNFGIGSIVEGSADISAGSLKVLNGLSALYDFDNDRTDSDSSQFLVLRSDSALTGTFANVDTSMLPFMRVTVAYDTSGTGGTVRLAAGLNNQALADLLGVEVSVVVLPPDDNGGDGNGDGNGDDVEQPSVPVPQPPEISAPEVNTNKNQIAVLIDANEQQDAADQDPVIKELSDAISMIPMDPANPEAHMEARDAILESVAAEMHASIKSTQMLFSAGLQSAASEQAGAAIGSLGSQDIRDTRFSLERKQWGFVGGEAGPAIWVKALVAKSEADGGQFANIDYEGGSFLVGADANVGDSLRLGGFGGASNWDIVQGGGNEGKDKSRHFGAYVGLRHILVLRSGISYTQHDITAERTAVMTVKLSSEYEAKTYSFSGELSRKIEIDGGKSMFEPFAGVSYTRHQIEKFSETRENGSRFSTVAEKASNMSSLDLGLRAATEHLKTNMYGSVAWRIPLKSPDILVPQSVGNSQAADIRGVPITGKGFRVKVGFDFALQDNLSAGLACDYSRLTSSNSQYSFEGRLTYSF